MRAGHPWVYAESIREQNRPGAAGELAVIYDRRDRFLAIGLFDPESPLRVRVLHAGQPEAIDSTWWTGRFRAAVARRTGICDETTNGLRWLSGESDGWPGLVLDQYAGTLVLKLYTVAWLPRLEEVAALAVSELRPGALVLRLSRNVQAAARAKFGREDGSLLCGRLPEDPVIFLENGLRFEADVRLGQKTGFFLDQRENRRRVGDLARGRRVLNAFSFSGGFSLYAARGGAPHVADLDISAHALESAHRNFALNEAIPAVRACVHERIKADAFDWLSGKRGDLFDLIVLDPPSLAKRESERAGALRAYRKLAADGLRQLAPGGILVCCSCSAHVNAREFFEAVRESVNGSGRALAEIASTGHPPDHPATFPEAEYLKAIYFEERR